MRQYHIALGLGEVGRYVLLPGNPGRVEKMACYLDEPEFVRQNREYTCWNGKLLGERVSIVSTGIGGPSAAIALEELIAIGADTFIRTGTCGALQPEIQRGDLIIASASVRGGATADAYVPVNYPAVAHHGIVSALLEASEARGYRHESGIIQCKDAFFLEEPHRLPRQIEAEQYWDCLRRAGVVASEMESDTLFVIGSLRKVRVGTVLLCLGGTAGEGAMVGTTPEELERMTFSALDALKLLIERDRRKQ